MTAVKYKDGAAVEACGLRRDMFEAGPYYDDKWVCVRVQSLRRAATPWWHLFLAASGKGMRRNANDVDHPCDFLVPEDFI